ncbi:hypothetical protein BC828DRAFT_389601 [Blastocladiella britannica]|nr:hypothetical protein BC828DRAFT_389601 [Blastocladiella britannica]
MSYYKRLRRARRSSSAAGVRARRRPLVVARVDTPKQRAHFSGGAAGRSTLAIDAIAHAAAMEPSIVALEPRGSSDRQRLDQPQRRLPAVVPRQLLDLVLGGGPSHPAVLAVADPQLHLPDKPAHGHGGHRLRIRVDNAATDHRKRAVGGAGGRGRQLRVHGPARTRLTHATTRRVERHVHLVGPTRHGPLGARRTARGNLGRNKRAEVGVRERGQVGHGGGRGAHGHAWHRRRSSSGCSNRNGRRKLGGQRDGRDHERHHFAQTMHRRNLGVGQAQVRDHVFGVERLEGQVRCRERLGKTGLDGAPAAVVGSVDLRQARIEACELGGAEDRPDRVLRGHLC